MGGKRAVAPCLIHTRGRDPDLPPRDPRGRVEILRSGGAPLRPGAAKSPARHGGRTARGVGFAQASVREAQPNWVSRPKTLVWAEVRSLICIGRPPALAEGAIVERRHPHRPHAVAARQPGEHRASILSVVQATGASAFTLRASAASSPNRPQRARPFTPHSSSRCWP